MISIPAPVDIVAHSNHENRESTGGNMNVQGSFADSGRRKAKALMVRSRFVIEGHYGVIVRYYEVRPCRWVLHYKELDFDEEVVTGGSQFLVWPPS